LRREAGAEAAQREALQARLGSTAASCYPLIMLHPLIMQARLESAAALLAASDERAMAAAELATKAEAAVRALEEERRVAAVQANELRGQQRAWQHEQEAHASRLQLARKQEALLREQNELLHVQVQQQRAASSALEGDVRGLEAFCAQLESRCESYEVERRASRG